MRDVLQLHGARKVHAFFATNNRIRLHGVEQAFAKHYASVWCEAFIATGSFSPALSFVRTFLVC
jgi:hypothetical protein